MKKAFIIVIAISAIWRSSMAYDFSQNVSSGQELYFEFYETGVKVVGSNYFASGNLAIPNSVTFNGTTYSICSIGDRAFRDRSGLTSVTIPNSVTSIGSSAFAECSGLTSVTIPNSITSIGDYAFSQCSDLTSVYFTGTIADWCNISFENMYSNPLNCAHHLFINNVEVTNLYIPDSVSSIGDYAFYGCSGLTSITIPNPVPSLGDRAFLHCSMLTAVYFTGTIADWCNTSFENGTSNPLYYAHHLFINNVEVTNPSIPDSVTSIGDYAFCNCFGLTSVTIPNSVTAIGRSAFVNCSMLTSVTIPNSVSSIGDYAFYECPGLTSVTIPNSVTSIGDYAFYKCPGLTSVIIPNSVTSIGDYAFSYCSGLSSVNLPNSITEIKRGTFSHCDNIQSITIPSSVTSISSSAFYSCNILSIIEIGIGILSIGENAFGACPGVMKVRMHTSEPPIIHQGTFGINPNAVIEIPCGSIESYTYTAHYANYNLEETLDYDFSVTSSDISRGRVDILTAPSCNNPEAQIQALPYHGYHFARWSDGNTDNPRYIVVLEDVDIEAIFLAEGENAGINTDNTSDVHIFQRGGCVVIENAERSPVTIYDMTGRVLAMWHDGQQTIQFKVPVAGTYLVRVGDLPAQRVVVVL